MPTTSLDLTGKTALVTGGARGIGRAVATLLCERGAAVAITYRSSSDAAEAFVKEVEANGGTAFALQADASGAEAAQAGVAAAAESLGGKIDILVNNAGLFEMGPLEGEGSGEADAAFERMLDVNVKGVWYTTRAAAAVLNDGGRIVNLGSVVGQRVPFPGASAYGMTKHAVSGLTKGWARDLAGRGITVNTVEPGPIDTDMNPDSPDNQMAEGMKSMVPMGRYGQTREVAELVCFLASDAAGFISGANVTIDGGMIA